MALLAKKYFTFTDGNGQKHRLEAEHPVQQTNDIRIVCDGPRCADLNNPGRDPVTYAWQEDEAVKDPSSLIPDGFFRVINAEFVRGGGAKTFCSRRCLTDYLNSVYVPPLSPREEEAQRVRNLEAVAVHLVDNPEGA